MSQPTMSGLIHVLICFGTVFILLSVVWGIYFWKIRPNEEWRKSMPMSKDDYKRTDDDR